MSDPLVLVKQGGSINGSHPINLTVNSPETEVKFGQKSAEGRR